MNISETLNQGAKFILVGCSSAKERDGMSEFWHVLVKYLKIKPIDISELPIRGLFLTAIEEYPEKVLKKILVKNINELFDFKICKKFTPIDFLMKSDLGFLEPILENELQKIPKNKKWRITVNRRHTKIKSREVIEKIASHKNAPKGKVDLENPDWVINVEIFGEWMGFGVYEKKSIFSLEKDM